MERTVSVILGLYNIVLFLNDQKIVLHLQCAGQQINIIYKRANHPYPCNIIQVVPDALIRHLISVRT